ncbi:MAG: polyphosphate kinase 2, partial [Luteimonas sp.]
LPDTAVPEAALDFPPLAGKPAKERYGVLKPLPVKT